MNHSRLWIAAALIAVFVIGGFALSVPHTRDVGMKQALTTAALPAPKIVLHDSFKKGVHTISGSVTAPNACSSVTADTSLSGDASTTQTIVVAITMPSDAGVCLQVPTPLSFSSIVSAPAGVPITVTVNGAAASTTSS